MHAVSERHLNLPVASKHVDWGSLQILFDYDSTSCTLHILFTSMMYETYLSLYSDHNSLALLIFHPCEFGPQYHAVCVQCSLLQLSRRFRQSPPLVLQFLYQQMPHNLSYKQRVASLSISQFHFHTYHPGGSTKSKVRQPKSKYHTFVKKN